VPGRDGRGEPQLPPLDLPDVGAAPLQRVQRGLFDRVPVHAGHPAAERHPKEADDGVRTRLRVRQVPRERRAGVADRDGHGLGGAGDPDHVQATLGGALGLVPVGVGYEHRPHARCLLHQEADLAFDLRDGAHRPVRLHRCGGDHVRSDRPQEEA